VSHSSCILRIMAVYTAGAFIGPKGMTLNVYFSVGAKEGKFLLIQEADTDLMVALARVEADKP